MKLTQKKVNRSKCQIHPKATDAFLLSAAMQFQLAPEWSVALGLHEVDLPWVVTDPTTGNHLVFAYWTSFLPYFKQTNDGDNKTVDVIVWTGYPHDIDKVAWKYLSSIARISQHRQSGLVELARLIEELPSDLKRHLEEHANNTRSLETLLRRYTREPDGKHPRGPARVACKKLKQAKDNSDD